MRTYVLLLACIICFLNSCAMKRPASGQVTQQDVDMFRKTFEGTLLNKKSEEFVRKEPVWGLSFWTKPVTAHYLQLTVMDGNGKVRKFYEYSEDKDRMNVLTQYSRELMNGDVVVIDMGFIDENQPEELFDSVTKKSP